MKTLKLALVALTIFTACLTVKASGIEDNMPASQYKAINTYVDAVMRGRVAGFDQVIDNGAKFSVLRGNAIMSFTKQQMIDFVKETRNQEQGCTINTSIVSSNPDVAVVKVEQQYDGFTRTNYVTLANNGKDWKITDVYSVFK